MKNISLGKKTEYKNSYDVNLLDPVPRSLARDQIGIAHPLPFNGVDIWNCYEVSWLNNKGKPCVKVMQFEVPADSKYLIESKSLKLYLNSLNNTKFESEEKLLSIIEKDLSDVAGSKVTVILQELSSLQNESISLFDGVNIDYLDVEIDQYNVDSVLLQNDTDNKVVEETICSNLLKSNCLITNQPDWASLQIKYKGVQIDHKSLLKYIISFRNHSEFHEQCVEHIFNDIMSRCKISELTVYAKYTRRGGVDINPFRTSHPMDKVLVHKTRDVRQ